ncbi:MAG: class II aldolase/adducin family protein [Bdellovibrionaceae bacterium]|nr:class II aldolase/adducin family protein [Bdellovibrionales bacterium]MCB9086583.1 class II aldolase/adducin family protein [Pseudobdellovibrionaceae bacterium]
MESPSEIELHDKIIQVCQRLYNRNMLAAGDGNVSYRVSDEHIIMTPSGRAKAFLKREEMTAVDLAGEVLSGKPSNEMLMHLEIYRQCPKAKAVVHAHPPHAVAWSVARPDLAELPATALAEVILTTGGIPIVPYARPGTSAMGEVLRPYLPDHRLMVLSRHGGLSWGEDLDEAVNGMERLEHSAQMLAIAQGLGGLTSLPEDEVRQLKELRKQIGERLL